MRVYRVGTSSGAAVEWVGTKEQAERCSDDHTWDLVEVPENKAGLLGWLNENAVGLSDDDGPIVAAAPPAPAPFVTKSETMDEGLRRITVEEEIQSCDLPRLANLASNVAWRFQELSKLGGGA